MSKYHQSPSSPLKSHTPLTEPKEKDTLDVYFDRSLLTRNLCIAGLGLSWAVALFCIIFGSYVARHYYAPRVHWDFLRDTLILAQTVVLTICQDSLGYIHTISLRWALQQDGQLEFNSNSRLWQNVKTRGPNAWYGNCIVILGQVLTFGTSAMTFAEEADSGDTWIWFLSEAWIILGIGIGMQAGVATWALLSHRDWPTWSSNPYDVAAACMNQPRHRLLYRQGRCLQGLDQALTPAMSTYPTSRQVCAYKSNNHIRRLTWVVWAVFGLCLIWTISVLIDTAVEFSGLLSRSGQWNPFDFSGGIAIPLLNKDYSIYGIIPRDFIWLFVLICILQSVVTLATHCVELHVNMSRDEATWREASSKKGIARHSNALQNVVTSYQSIVLVVLKVGAQWFFGLTFSIDIYEGMYLSGPQALYLTIIILILVLFATWLVLQKPKGPQPATFGHLQTLVDLIDEWPRAEDTMFWGDKEEKRRAQVTSNYTNMRHAGTGRTPLESIVMSAKYA